MYLILRRVDGKLYVLKDQSGHIKIYKRHNEAIRALRKEETGDFKKCKHWIMGAIRIEDIERE